MRPSNMCMIKNGDYFFIRQGYTEPMKYREPVIMTGFFDDLMVFKISASLFLIISKLLKPLFFKYSEMIRLSVESE